MNLNKTRTKLTKVFVKIKVKNVILNLIILNKSWIEMFKICLKFFRNCYISNSKVIKEQTIAKK